MGYVVDLQCLEDGVVVRCGDVAHDHRQNQGDVLRAVLRPEVDEEKGVIKMMCNVGRIAVFSIMKQTQN